MCFPSPLSLEKYFFEGLLLISGIKFMQSTIHIISVIVYVCVCVCVSVGVFVFVCGAVHGSSLSSSCP